MTVLCPWVWRTPSSDPSENENVSGRFLVLCLRMCPYHLCFWSTALLKYSHLSFLSPFSAWEMCPPPASISSGELWSHVEESCVEEETFLLLSFSSFWPYGPTVCKCVYTGHLWGLLDMYINASHQAWEVWGHCFSKPAPRLFLTFLLVSLWCTCWYSCSWPGGPRLCSFLLWFSLFLRMNNSRPFISSS